MFDTLSTYLGSANVNDFKYLGHTYRVTAQADMPFHLTVENVGDLMIGVIVAGLFLTPTFYVVGRAIADRFAGRTAPRSQPEEHTDTPPPGPADVEPKPT